MRTAIVGLLMLSTGAAGIAHGMESRFEKTIAAELHGSVEISNVSGTIEVTGWDKPEVGVEAEVGGGVERIDVEGSKGRVSVKVIIPNHSFRSGSTNLRVHVPRGSDLDVSGVSADVSAEDVEGRLQLKTVSGTVKADVFQKNTEIKTVSGDVVLRGRGKEPGTEGIHVSSISGSIRVDRAGGDLEATSVSGDMTLRLDHAAHEVRVRTTSGDVGFEGKLTKGAYFEAQTVSGDLSVRAAPEGSLDYEVNTFSGEIQNCMGVDTERVSKYGPGRRLNGTRGPPGSDPARIRLKSMSGDVELCDKR
jgi:DUF4097 and DUF4098 domain-containing protein YvlB